MNQDSTVKSRKKQKLWVTLLLMFSVIAVGKGYEYWRFGGQANSPGRYAAQSRPVPIIVVSGVSFCPELPAGLHFFTDTPQTIIEKMGRPPDTSYHTSEHLYFLTYKISNQFGFKSSDLIFTFFDNGLDSVGVKYEHPVFNENEEADFKALALKLESHLFAVFGEQFEFSEKEAIRDQMSPFGVLRFYTWKHENAMICLLVTPANENRMSALALIGPLDKQYREPGPVQ